MKARSLVATFLLLMTGAVNAAEKSVEETAGAWQILCFDDDAARYRSCYVMRGDLSVLISSQEYQLVFVGSGSDRQPGSEVTVRVDGDPPIVWREDDFYADEAFTSAVKQFRAGRTAAFTWSRKDTGESVKGQVSLIGFTRAYRRAQEIVSAYEPEP